MMRLQNSSQIGLLLLVVGCGSPNEPGNMVSAGGGAEPRPMGGTSSAGASNSGGVTAAGNSSGNPSNGGGGVGAGAGGTSGAPSSGGAGAGSGSSGAAGGGGASAGRSGGGSSYEPIVDDKLDEMPLFDGQPPNFKAGAPAETVNAQGSISNVSVPQLRRFAMDGSKATGFG